jgi:UDP-N-acetylmuramoyl-L-alanyl-D-glutamate--2,6-diaminopimelate ligase
MPLGQVLAGEALPAGAGEIAVTGLTADSRQVAAGFLFVAIPGTVADGAKFVPDAVAKGAVAVVAAAGAEIAGAGVPVIRVEEARLALARAAARFHGPQPGCVLAVTGTSGKTSVAEFTRQILAHLGMPAASLGTLGVVRPDGATYGSLTTPDPVTLHRTLGELAAAGVTHVAMEASSHGLDQYRLDGVEIAAAAFTNLGRDHLDYHPTVEDYFRAKMRLFEELLAPGRPAVVNTDGARAQDVSAIARRRGHRLITVGRAGETVRLDGAVADGSGQVLTLGLGGETVQVRLGLIGAYQVENALTAAGLAIAAGEAPRRVIEALAHLKGVSGRLDVVGEKDGVLVVVDYAHKPEALEAALAAVRPFAKGRLVCVFGCGGDRDRGKRAIMGGIAGEKADLTIVTDDNPRTEEPAAIRREIVAGIGAGARYEEIGDRRQAIMTAVGGARAGDVVLIAGKGHETGQIVGKEVLPFSDHEVAKEAMGLVG